MSQLNEIDVADKIIDAITDIPPSDMRTDNDGQLLIYTGVYRWKDGSFHTGAEPIDELPETPCDDADCG